MRSATASATSSRSATGVQSRPQQQQGQQLHASQKGPLSKANASHQHSMVASAPEDGKSMSQMHKRSASFHYPDGTSRVTHRYLNFRSKVIQNRFHFCAFLLAFTALKKTLTTRKTTTKSHDFMKSTTTSSSLLTILAGSSLPGGLIEGLLREVVEGLDQRARRNPGLN